MGLILTLILVGLSMITAGWWICFKMDYERYCWQTTLGEFFVAIPFMFLALWLMSVFGILK